MHLNLFVVELLCCVCQELTSDSSRLSESSVILLDVSCGFAMCGLPWSAGAMWPMDCRLALCAVERYLYFPATRKRFGMEGRALLQLDRWGRCAFESVGVGEGREKRSKPTAVWRPVAIESLENAYHICRCFPEGQEKGDTGELLRGNFG